MPSVFISLSLFLVCSLSQVPPEDACQYVNQTEPPQCPKTIGPPCPPCIVNSAPDYQTGDAVTIDTATRTVIEEFMLTYTNYWPAHYPPKIATQGGASIVQGSAGRALLFVRMYNSTLNTSYLNLAREYIDVAIQQLKEPGDEYASYFAGRVGVYVLAAQIAKIQNSNSDVTAYINDAKSVFQDVQNGINMNGTKSPIYEIDMYDGCIMTGIGGLLYSGMLFNEYFGENTIDNGYIVNISHYLVTMGLETAKQYNNKGYLIYEFHYEANCYLPGSAEGNGGVIKMLLEAYNRGYVDDLMTDSYYKTAIQNTLNWYVDIQLKDGNIPTYTTDVAETCGSVYGNDSDARVQWCHGAPGFIDTLSLAAVAFDSFGDDTSAKIYLNAALMAYNSTWERGLLVKGLMQCHGIGGTTNTLLHIFKNLQIISKRNSLLNTEFNVPFLMNQSLWRAIQFVKFTLDELNLNALRTQYSNEDYSMWLGSYGIVVLYVDTIQPGWPLDTSACMPAWDFCGF